LTSPQILELSDILTSAQRLYHNGKEVAELTKTVVDIGLQRKDYVFLREVVDTIELFSDDECYKQTKRKRNEGDGFGGTLLSGILRDNSSRTSRADSENEVDELKAEDGVEESAPRTCSRCTYVNGPEFFCCEMCQVPL
jgi:ubiquitin carboxyl-terminal hydrolase 48